MKSLLFIFKVTYKDRNSFGYVSTYVLCNMYANLLKEGACILFFCHSHSHSHNDISNVYLLVLSKAMTDK